MRVKMPLNNFSPNDIVKWHSSLSLIVKSEKILQNLNNLQEDKYNS